MAVQNFEEQTECSECHYHCIIMRGWSILREERWCHKKHYSTFYLEWKKKWINLRVFQIFLLIVIFGTCFLNSILICTVCPFPCIFIMAIDSQVWIPNLGAGTCYRLFGSSVFGLILPRK